LLKDFDAGLKQFFGVSGRLSDSLLGDLFKKKPRRIVAQVCYWKSGQSFKLNVIVQLQQLA